MTSLATQSLSPADRAHLELVADNVTPLGRLRADDFKAACLEDAAAHEGWVNPNRVSAILRGRFGDLNPRSLSAQWQSACGPKGFMRKTDVEVPIDPTFSRGNGGKSLRMRRVVES